MNWCVEAEPTFEKGDLTCMSCGAPSTRSGRALCPEILLYRQVWKAIDQLQEKVCPEVLV